MLEIIKEAGVVAGNGGNKMRCPGSDSRNLRVELHKCPKCGADVEIFSDESRIKCQKCGTIVYREKTPT